MPSEDQPPNRPGWSQWPAWCRWSTMLAAAVLCLILILTIAMVVLVRKPLPKTSGELRLSGLDTQVEVLRDAQGVPHIYASTSHDLFFAQGFVQAQDRFWQMDFGRMLTAGRLSELFGKETLSTDVAIRTMGWRRVAEQELDLLNPQTKSALTSFSEGVNAYIEERSPSGLSLEYTVLGLSGLDYAPERWTAVDSLAWLKAMAWDLRSNVDTEISRANLHPHLEDEQVEDLFPPYPYDTNPTIMNWSKAKRAEAGGGGKKPRVAGPKVHRSSSPLGPSESSGPAQIESGAETQPESGAETDARAADAILRAQRAIAEVPHLFGEGEGIGSNSFVLSGELTESGKPILENDPHLGAHQPNVWYQSGLHCRSVNDECPYDVSGGSLPGVPGIIAGHNQTIAWGVTNLNADVVDLYLERIEGDGSVKGKKLVPLIEREEVIKVRGAQDRKITVRSTRHGPVISDESPRYASVGANAVVPDGSPERDRGYAVALSWTALTPRPTMEAILKVNKAQNFADFRAAARKFSVPSQNLIYADIEGNIGYQAPGLIPVRMKKADGLEPAPGWDTSYDWQGFIPYKELPFEYNPKKGFIVTANNAVVPKNYPYLISNTFDSGYRAQRITELIEQHRSKGPISVSDVESILLDAQHPIADQLVPRLLDVEMNPGYYSDGQRLLASWDGQQSVDSAAAAFFNVTWSNVLENTFADQLPEGFGLTGGHKGVLVMSKLLDDPENPWWDNVLTEEVVEDRDDILAQALVESRDELTRRQSVDADSWEWGRTHQLRMNHESLGSTGNPILNRIFNRGPYPISGGSATVNATNWNANLGYTMTSGPSMRMVVDLADLDSSVWINMGGQSGHVASRHYADQSKMWAREEFLAWPNSTEAVAEATRHTLLLRPVEPVP